VFFNSENDANNQHNMPLCCFTASIYSLQCSVPQRNPTSYS